MFCQVYCFEHPGFTSTLKYDVTVTIVSLSSWFCLSFPVLRLTLFYFDFIVIMRSNRSLQVNYYFGAVTSILIRLSFKERASESMTMDSTPSSFLFITVFNGRYQCEKSDTGDSSSQPSLVLQASRS